MKRDMEEQKRDIETAQYLQLQNVHQKFFETFQALRAIKPGDEIALGRWRGGSRRKFDCTVEIVE